MSKKTRQIRILKALQKELEKIQTNGNLSDRGEMSSIIIKRKIYETTKKLQAYRRSARKVHKHVKEILAGRKS